MHLFCLSNVFCQNFHAEQVPSDEFIRHWLRAYYEESNRLDGVRMTEDELEQLVDIELKKVLINMLLTRVLLVQRALAFLFNYPKKICAKAAVKYAVQVYDDFIRHRDQNLKLLDKLRK